MNKTRQTQILSLVILVAIATSTLAGCAQPTQPIPSPSVPEATSTPPAETPPQPEEEEPTPTSPPPEEIPISEVAQSKLARLTSPEATTSELAALAEGNSAFAFDLYQSLRQQNGNLFYSPYSISLALAMTYAGARGETERQMADTLDFNLPQERLHPTFNALDLELASRSAEAEAENPPFQLNIANSIWAQGDYAFLPEFLDLLAENYGAGLQLADFINASEAARLSINDWVSEHTQGKIKDLIPPGAINSLTRLVLANAIYFKARWLHPFEEALTQEGDFYLLDGSQTSVPMMSFSLPTSLFYAQGEGYQALELPYFNDTASMLILVPDAGRFSEFEATLDTQRLNEVLSSLQPKNIALQFPKFEFEATTGLKDTLTALGMPDAFDAQKADFSGIDGSRDLLISDVLHKAFVAVDETGTEAAAATAVIVGVTSLPEVDVELKVDRPFIFLIRDNETGTILFAGRVLQP